MGIEVSYAPAAGRVLSGSYTLSSGITPSIIQLETAPLDGIYLPSYSDIGFADGENTYTLPNCRLVDVSARNSDGGTTWVLQFEDERWKWSYGWISGEYNPESRQVKSGVYPATGTDEYAAKKSAWELAGLLQAKMGGFFTIDRAALPDDDFPYVNWDYANAAEELANLADRYGLLVIYDPLDSRVSLLKRGEGDELPTGLPYLNLDTAQTNLRKPAELLGVCEKTAYEWEFDLEAVGIDTDGTVKLLANLSYKPAGGWGAGVTEGSFADIADEEDKKDAERSVYRWYRVKPKTILTGDKAVWTPASLKEMLPLQKELLTTTVETDFNGEKRVVHREAYCYGTFVNTDKKLANRANVSTPQKITAEHFTLDGKNGIVRFQSPVWKFDGSSNVVAADLKLRCVVHGARHEVSKSVGGSYGTLVVPCEGLRVEEIQQDYFGVTTPVYGGNIAVVEREANVILAAKARAYEESTASSARYIGIHDIKLDGKIQQRGWEVGPGGAFTTASVNTEHDYRIPGAAERRALERGRRKVAENMEPVEAEPVSPAAIPKSVVFAPRFIQIYNNAGETIPAFGLVEITASNANGYFSVTKPSADYLSVGKVLVNGELPIAAGCYGIAQASDAFMFLATGTPAVGDEFGTTANSYYGKVSTEEGTGGILVCGATTGVSGVALGRFF